MKFEPFGPFEIPRKENGLVDAEDSAMAFWSAVEEQVEGLSSAVGCYIFSIRAGRGSLPWYVGKAEKQTFRQECFTPHKLNIFNEQVASRNGTPMLTLVTKFTPTGRYSNKSKNGHRDVSFLENMLISLAIQRNPEIANARSTRFMREMVVSGILNSSNGRNSSRVNDFRALVGA